ncbi:hypothetical protein C8T65DRAFT_677868 [Cerioporus squamosus]|nr:hypothetical protein C8T65DRAFT_677851 [Cerioporus squamosus]KAI0686084.1 hypothetical protein C8T65DRAFT_677868 [Cerioporus squamosus]
MCLQCKRSAYVLNTQIKTVHTFVTSLRPLVLREARGWRHRQNHSDWWVSVALVGRRRQVTVRGHATRKKGGRSQSGYVSTRRYHRSGRGDCVVVHPVLDLHVRGQSRPFYDRLCPL